jgi:O-antigen/teichoic acid export membrane protein
VTQRRRAEHQEDVPEKPQLDNKKMHRDAASLASSSIANAVFGVVSWAITARLIEPAALGIMTATLAMINLPALAIVTPIGDAFAALLMSAGSDKLRLVLRGCRLFVGASILAGSGAATVAVVTIDDSSNPWPVFFLVLFGTLLFGLYLLQCSLLVATGRANLLLATATVMNLLRVALLIALSLTTRWHSLELSIVIAAGLVGTILVPFSLRIVRRLSGPPIPESAGEHGSANKFDAYISRVFFVILFGFAIFTVTPYLVTFFSTSEQGALFALALPAVQTLDLIGAAMSTSLVVHASTANRIESAAMAKSVLLRAALIVGTGAVFIAIAAPLALHYLNPRYSAHDAAVVIGLLCGASFLKIPFTAWSGLQRSRRDLRPLLMATSLGGCVAVIGACLLATKYGAAGGALAILLASATLSLGSALHVIRRR